MPFTGESRYVPFEITADWLFARTEDRRKRCFIHGHYFYVRPKNGDSRSIEKYRFLGRTVIRYTLKIVAI